MARKRPARKAVVTCPRCGGEADPSAGAVNYCPSCGADLRAPPDPSQTGGFVHRVIAERYRLVALVGEGGMGAVYRAEHIRMGKALALKILRGDFAREPGAVDRFLAEARIVSRLSHPHTIAVFDFGEIDAAGSGFYLAMEFVPGKDLATLLEESGPLAEHRVAEIGQQVLGSLAEAHDAGIVHRDVKPGNVMLMQTRSGEDWVKVLDFGIAKLRHGPADREGRGAPAASASTTGVGAIVGTPNYVAPEQARAGAVDARADLYAVGCLLYELVAGRPPFVAPSAMAVVAAHLHDEPPPLDRVAGVSRRFAEVIHRALAKKPEDRFTSADAMREALAAIAEPTGARPLSREGAPEVSGALRIARREDFAEFDRQIRALRRGRVLAPLIALAAVLALGAATWRRGDVYALLAASAPRLAAALPDALRPGAGFDGEEHEPNDTPAGANPLPIPAGADGQPAGGVAEVRGHVGAKLSNTIGDVDLYRIEVPATARGKVIVAEWRGERAGEGIRGLDVALTLNRARAADDARPSAPLVASVNRGGPGRPERLVAAVEPGVYYLAVRERHDDATGPVEKPTDRYLMSVRLADPESGREIEPDDGPDREAAGPERYPAWRAAAERNLLLEGASVGGDTAPDDPDLFAITPRAGGDAPELVVIVPEPGLALSARIWRPDADDLVAGARGDRVRFEDAGTGAPGEVLVAMKLGARQGAPALLLVRAADGQGGYDVFALGRSPASGAAALGLVGRLADAGRTAGALEIAAAYASALPGAVSRDELLLEAGKLAERLAPGLAPEALGTFDRAAVFLGAAIFERGEGKVRYGAAFEARVAPDGPAAAEAAARVQALAASAPPAAAAAPPSP